MDHYYICRYPPSILMQKLNHQDFLKSFTEIKVKRNVIFYLHIPFCPTSCNFCNFFKITNPEKSVRDSYVDHLIKEINFYGDLLSEKVNVSSILFGGGTPTILDGAQLGKIVENLRNSFNIKNNIEISIESRSDTLNNEKLDLLRKAGFNRLSIGVQSFNEQVNKVCGRNQRPFEVKNVVNGARDAGFRNINLDLMYGLPGQTLNTWKQTLETAHSLDVEGFTAYELLVIPPSEFYDQRKNISFVSEKDMLNMHIEAINFFTNKGYDQIFSDQFIRKGVKADFLASLWGNEECVGFGASARSYFYGWDYNNPHSLPEYLDHIDKLGLAAEKGKRLNKKEQMTREIVLGIKRSGVNLDKPGIDKQDFSFKYHADIDYIFNKTIKKLEKLGLIENTKERLNLTEKGMLFPDEVAFQFYGEGIPKES